jgi:hypothetical protein
LIEGIIEQDEESGVVLGKIEQRKKILASKGTRSHSPRQERGPIKKHGGESTEKQGKSQEERVWGLPALLEEAGSPIDGNGAASLQGNS